MFNCPLCHLPLALHSRSWRCLNRHQFDVAREGYVNLLPVQHKASKQPGDNKAMMQARRAFLDAGHYQALQQAVTGWLGQRVESSQARLLDIGCGEGYYTAAVARAFAMRSGAQIYGLDVSREAIRSAAKRYPDVHFCVASSHRLPFADGSLDAILRIYAPCRAEEMHRVLRPDGLVLAVTPGPYHLWQLKQRIYQQVQLHADGGKPLTGFRLQAERSLNYEMVLTGAQACRLLQMTPFAWRASETVWHELAQVTRFACQADFHLTLWQRD